MRATEITVIPNLVYITLTSYSNSTPLCILGKPVMGVGERKEAYTLSIPQPMKQINFPLAYQKALHLR